MDFDPSFRVHLAQPHGMADVSVIISTAYTDATGHPESEWFLVIPEEKGILYAQRNRLDLQAVPGERMDLDEEFFLGEALDQAVLRLRSHIAKTREASAVELLAAQTSVQPCDEDQLAKLWMRGACCGCLSEIRAKSRCAPLIDTLVWVHGLPMLAATDL